MYGYYLETLVGYALNNIKPKVNLKVTKIGGKADTVEKFDKFTKITLIGYRAFIEAYKRIPISVKESDRIKRIMRFLSGLIRNVDYRNLLRIFECMDLNEKLIMDGVIVCVRKRIMQIHMKSFYRIPIDQIQVSLGVDSDGLKLLLNDLACDDLNSSESDLLLRPAVRRN